MHLSEKFGTDEPVAELDNKELFDKLYGQYHQQFKQYCEASFFRTPPAGMSYHVHLDDFLQDIRTKVYKNINRYEPGSNFFAWIKRIAINQYINLYRKNKKMNVTGDSTDHDYYINTTPHKTVTNEGETQLTTEQLEQIVDQLNDSQKVPFQLHYYGHKYDEIAELLDMPLGTVKSRIHFARKSLRQLLLEEEYPLNHTRKKKAQAASQGNR